MLLQLQVDLDDCNHIPRMIIMHVIFVVTQGFSKFLDLLKIRDFSHQLVRVHGKLVFGRRQKSGLKFVRDIY